MVSFDWRAELVAELSEAAEQARVNRIEDGPQFAQPVLNRRTGERQLLVCGESPNCLGGFRVRVLDHLGFVEDDGRPIDPTEVFEIARKQTVGSDHQLAFRINREQFAALIMAGTDVLLAGRTVMHSHVELGRESFALCAPVSNNAQRADDEVRAWSFE